ncbi:MAG TPA: hypothetical protein VFG76_04630, partial [Candidatus Polarisedimenticolia bacterium]|nr:hypothetical protein [Candidatus Polarisedimenticolia bacterium]
ATIWEHTLAVLLVTAALIPLTKALGGDATGWHGAAAGLLLGCAAAVRTETALIAPAAVAAGLIVAGWKGFGRQAMTLTMGVLVILVPRAYLHRQVFGSWLPPHLTANPALQPLLGAYDLLLPVAARGLVTVLLVGSVAFGLMGARLRWRPPQFALTAAGLSACAIILAAGPLLTLALEISPRALSTEARGYRSLAHTMPLIALVPLAAILPAPRWAPRHRFLAWTAGLFIVSIVALTPQAGGLQWGPRLLLAAVPAMTIVLIAGLASGLGRAESGPALVCLWIGLALGLAMQTVGLRFLTRVRTHNAAMMAAVRDDVPVGGVVLSDVFSIPQLLAPLSRGRHILYVRPDSDLERLESRLGPEGDDVHWITRRRESDGDNPARAGRDLGGGLVLSAPTGDPGTRPFMSPQRGD